MEFLNNIMQSKVLLVGSIAFDVIFSLSQDFQSAIPIKNGTIRNFNASYTAQEKKEYCGGNAGNIAYWLGKEGIQNTIFSSWGKDFEEKGYRTKLEKLGVSFRGSEGEFTAHAYMVSDPLHQQLIIWQPNAYELHNIHSIKDFFSEFELANVEIAIISAALPETMLKHLKQFRSTQKNALVFFDPGHSIPLFSKEIFQECQEYSDILIGNDIEFQYFRNFGISSSIGQIETLGKKGVKAKIEGRQYRFPANLVEKVVETTGAGDAFRAGIISGVLEKKTWEERLKKGIDLGAKCVAIKSGQGE
jgi:adenosine kinase